MRPSRTNGPGVNATCISATARDPTNRLGCAALFPASASPVTISRLTWNLSARRKRAGHVGAARVGIRLHPPYLVRAAASPLLTF
jgi:hypothetical protein